MSFDKIKSTSVEDFDGLSAQKEEFLSSEDEQLVGYFYSYPQESYKGLVVFAHGMGSGGHLPYMPIIEALAQRGYLVFAYDATANGESEGDSLRGLPQGISDLDSAIDHVQKNEKYASMPLFLVGHSWGAYSVGNVLALHPEVDAAVLLSGFDSSLDMMCKDAEQYVGGFLVSVAKPFLAIYNWVKFGSLAGASVVDAVSESDARVLVVHSSDDTVAPMAIGYDSLYEEFSNDARVDFVLYEDRGHGYIYCSEESASYRNELEESYSKYVEQNGGEPSDELESKFMNENIDKHIGFEVDEALIDRMVATFEKP